MKADKRWKCSGEVHDRSGKLLADKASVNRLMGHIPIVHINEVTRHVHAFCKWRHVRLKDFPKSEATHKPYPAFSASITPPIQFLAFHRSVFSRNWHSSQWLIMSRCFQLSFQSDHPVALKVTVLIVGLLLFDIKCTKIVIVSKTENNVESIMKKNHNKLNLLLRFDYATSNWL